MIKAKSSSAVQRLVSRANGTMDLDFLERLDFEELDLEGIALPFFFSGAGRGVSTSSFLFCGGACLGGLGLGAAGSTLGFFGTGTSGFFGGGAGEGGFGGSGAFFSSCFTSSLTTCSGCGEGGGFGDDTGDGGDGCGEGLETTGD